MHAHRGAQLGAGLEERLPCAAVQRGQAELGGDLAERHGGDAAGRVAAQFSDGQVHVPQRDDLQRDQPPVALPGPLLDHPVVVGPDAGQPEVLVLGLGEGLPAEPGEGGEGQRTLDSVDVHVRQPLDRVVAAWAHLVVGDGRGRHLVTIEAHRGQVALVRDDQIAVDPAVRLGSVVVPVELVRRATAIAHPGQAATLDVGLVGVVLELLRQPPIEQMRRFDDVVVDTDDLRQVLDLAHI